MCTRKPKTECHDLTALPPSLPLFSPNLLSSSSSNRFKERKKSLSALPCTLYPTCPPKQHFCLRTPKSHHHSVHVCTASLPLLPVLMRLIPSFSDQQPLPNFFRSSCPIELCCYTYQLPPCRRYLSMPQPTVFPIQLGFLCGNHRL